MSTIDENGLVIDRYPEIKSQIDDALRAAFGEGIRITSDSVFGQLSAIMAERISDQNELIEQVSTIFNPNAAPGVWLSRLIKLNGLTRKEPIFSTVAVNVGANAAGSTIPAGSLVSDPAIGEKFALDAVAVLAPNEVKTVSATAVNAGAITAPAGTLTKIETPVFGWASVVNPADGSIGALQETDTAARIRREVASKQTGKANVSAIYSALFDLDAVDLLAIYENRSGTTDGNGVPGHSIWAVVSGGSDADIAEVLFNTTPAGIGFFGTVTVNHPDPITGQVYPVKFSRPVEVPIFVTYILQKSTTYPSNGDDLIKSQTIDFFEGGFTIDGVPVEPMGLGSVVVSSRLFTPANSVPGHRILSVLIGKTANPTSSNDVVMLPNEIPAVDLSTITIG
jgi:uncharacterized phage protein gp47/JayE